MENARLSEPLVSTYESTRRYNQEKRHQILHVFFIQYVVYDFAYSLALVLIYFADVTHYACLALFCLAFL